jgi:single-strand DNA-binding protein
MPNYNKVILMGNLVRDPELRYTPTSIPVVTLRLAVNTVFRTQQGEKKTESCFINVIVIGNQALPCTEYLAKGDPVFVEGRLQSRSWDDAQGQKRSTIEVVASRVQFISSKKKPLEEHIEVEEEIEPIEEEKKE